MNEDKVTLAENGDNGENQIPSPTQQIEAIDLYRYASADSEMKFILQSLECINYRKVNAILRREVTQLKIDIEVRNIDTMLLSEKDRLVGINKKYNDTMKDIADKYGIGDPKRMAIDDEKGTIREIPIVSSPGG